MLESNMVKLSQNQNCDGYNDGGIYQTCDQYLYNFKFWSLFQLLHSFFPPSPRSLLRGNDFQKWLPEGNE